MRVLDWLGSLLFLSAAVGLVVCLVCMPTAELLHLLKFFAALLFCALAAVASIGVAGFVWFFILGMD